MKNGTHKQDDSETTLDERAFSIARETLTGDIRDMILNDMKERKSNLPWNMRKQAEQEELIGQVTTLAEGIVRRAVEIVAAGGRKTIRAQLSQATVKDGIKAVIELSQFDEQRHQLIDSVGSSVLIVIADHEIYQGEKKPVHASPDQTSILGDEHDPDTGEITDKPRGKRKGGDEARA